MRPAELDTLKLQDPSLLLKTRGHVLQTSSPNIFAVFSWALTWFFQAHFGLDPQAHLGRPSGTQRAFPCTHLCRILEDPGPLLAPPPHSKGNPWEVWDIYTGAHGTIWLFLLAWESLALRSSPMAPEKSPGEQGSSALTPPITSCVALGK